jgi:hypothetical protein
VCVSAREIRGCGGRGGAEWEERDLSAELEQWLTDAADAGGADGGGGGEDGAEGGGEYPPLAKVAAAAASGAIV